MSWTDELLQIYNYNIGRDFDDGEPLMLPISHSTANAQVEITIDENGEFMGATTVDKNDAVTVIPDTGKARTSFSIAPHPINDTLKYVAKDFFNCTDDTEVKNKEFFVKNPYFYAYIELMERWNNSKFNHPAINAVLKYAKKSSIISDCIKCGILSLDNNGKLKSRHYGDTTDRVYIRFIVEYSSFGEERRTWKNSNLQNSFTNFLLSEKANEKSELCYVLGKELPISKTQPGKIIMNNANAKLISVNQKNGLVYKGRFLNSSQAFSISYEASQKIHCALKWLMSSGHLMAVDELNLIVWASLLCPIPKICDKLVDETEFDDDLMPQKSTAKMYCELLHKMIFSYKSSINLHTKVMIMGLEASGKGRISISFYSELRASDFLDYIEKWHRQMAWCRYNAKKKATIPNSFSLYEIINCAYGTEQGKKIECDKRLQREVVLSLIPCVTQGRNVPLSVVNALYHKASNPFSYENEYNHRAVVETACGMIRKSIIEKENNEQEDFLMAYDPNITDRSYLFGCLLAIADKAENESYDAEERGKRETNARRYWNAFVQHPYQTWGVIFKQLNPYLTKLGKSKMKYEKRINDILGKMNDRDFSDYRHLEPMYLLGYSHYTTKMFDEDLKRNKEEN